MTGPLDAERLRDAVQTVLARHPNLVARFCCQFDQPVQIITGRSCSAVALCRTRIGAATSRSRSQRICADERAAVCDLAHQSAFRVAVIRTADGPASAGADQSPHRGRRLVDADPAARNIRQLSRTAACRPPRPYRSYLTWLAERDREAAHAAWREVFADFDAPTLVAPPDRLGIGPRGSTSIQRASRHHARHRRTGTRAPHDRQRRAAGRLGTGADGADRPPRCRVRHHRVRTACRDRRCRIDGGPFHQHGAGTGEHHAGHHHRRPAAPAARFAHPYARASACDAWRYPPHRRSRAAVRHPLRLRELPRRRQHRHGRRPGHQRDHQPANAPTTRSFCKLRPATNSAFPSTTAPTSSTRNPLRRSWNGWRG